MIKREIYSLNSRLKKVDQQFSPTVQEEVNLVLLPYGESEDVEVHIQQQEVHAHNPEEEPGNRTDQFMELSSDKEEENLINPDINHGGCKQI